MKFTFITPALVAVLGLVLSGSFITAKAQAAAGSPTPATTTEPSTPDDASAVKKTPYRGTLTAVDASSITVKTAKESLTLAIAPTTKFKKDASAITDFAVGDKVSGSYTKDASGAMTAASVHKWKPKKKAAAADAAPAAQ